MAILEFVEARKRLGPPGVLYSIRTGAPGVVGNIRRV